MRICLNATDAVLADNNILILSDRATSPDRIAIPALLATGQQRQRAKPGAENNRKHSALAKTF